MPCCKNHLNLPPKPQEEDPNKPDAITIEAKIGF
jgi:hypothetical protein